jgi:hypothetical protein
MTDSADPNRDETAVGPGHEPTTGTPRWVKVFGIVAVAVVVLLVVVMVTGGPGRHGPGRHTPSDDRGDQTAPSAAPAQPGGHTGPPPGVEHDQP